jgi:hypothetical protein
MDRSVVFEMQQRFLKESFRNDVSAMQNLIRDGLPVNEPTESGSYLLIDAAGHGFKGAVSVLLKAGAEVNSAATYAGVTALIQAARSGRVEIVRSLIEAGANVNLPNKHAMTPIDYPILHDEDAPEYMQILEVLIAAGADVNWGPHLTVLMHAAQSGRPEMIRVLVAAGADTNILRPQGTALILAVRKNRFLNVRTLLELGADKSLRAPADSPIKDIAGKTALDVAVAAGQRPIITLLEA